MRELRITRGKRRTHPWIKSGKTTWKQLVKKLLDFKVTEETFAEYIDWTADRQADIKDVGYLVGGPFSGKTRKKNELICRSVVTLDVDHVDQVHKITDAYKGFEYVVHSTHKHSDDSPRLRLVFPLSRDVTPFEYEAVARNLAAWSDMDYFDDTTFEVSRIMYWPSRSVDGDVVAEHWTGDWVNPDDWDPGQDFIDWPRSSRVTSIHQPGLEAADPLTKSGWIGAFNRTYDIHAAIQNFLPDIFETTDWDNRYRPVGATGPAGAIVYDDVFLYSHHENPEAVSQKNVNAFDLVRLVLFGEGIDAEDPDVPMMQKESMKAMADFCAQDPQVVANSELGDLDEDFENVEVKPKPKSVEQFSDEMKDSNPQTSAECDVFLPRIAGYDPHETDQLLKILQDLYPIKPGIQALRDQVKRIRRQLAGHYKDDEIADVERELIQEILDERFLGGAHLRRIGRMFWAYRGGVWQMMGDEPVQGVIQKSIYRLREDRPEEVAQLVAAIGDSKTSALVGSLFRALIATLAQESEADGSKDPLLLRRRVLEPVVNCQNCELHFDYGGLMSVRDHDPDNFYTQQVDTGYNDKALCPEWDRFMDMVFRECVDPEDMQRHLEELGGYIISMSKWLKNWVLFRGPTDTGKSTILTVFKELLGSAGLAMEIGRFGGVGNSFADSMLLGKLLLADDDFDKSASLPDGFIKKISEEKLITSDIKFGAAVTFQSRALPLICSNHWPVTRDVSDAFRDRALVFEFHHQIRGAEQSDQRRNKMLDELPGILNRFVAGLSRLRERNGWSIPIDAAISHDTWVHQSNTAALFTYERVRKVEIGIGHVKRADVWRDYRHWQVGQGGFALSKREFFQRMEDLLGFATYYEGHLVYAGWKLLPPDLDFDDVDIGDDE